MCGLHVLVPCTLGRVLVYLFGNIISLPRSLQVKINKKTATVEIFHSWEPSSRHTTGDSFMGTHRISTIEGLLPPSTLGLLTFHLLPLGDSLPQGHSKLFLTHPKETAIYIIVSTLKLN